MTPSAKKRADQVNARKVAKDERRANINEIGSKRDAIESKKVSHPFLGRRAVVLMGQFADSMKRFNYLLGQTELFQHFIDLKVSWI